MVLGLAFRGGTCRALWRSGNDPYAVQRWAKSGVWEKVFKHLSDDADNEYAMIDSIVRATSTARTRKKGVRIKPSGAGAEGQHKIHATSMHSAIRWLSSHGGGHDLARAMPASRA